MLADRFVSWQKLPRPICILPYSPEKLSRVKTCSNLLIDKVCMGDILFFSHKCTSDRHLCTCTHLLKSLDGWMLGEVSLLGHILDLFRFIIQIFNRLVSSVKWSCML